MAAFIQELLTSARSGATPSPGASAVVNQALRAIVANLADNAVKHMAPDHPVREVQLSTRAVGGEVEVAVRDTGAGIPADVLPRLFEPFFRATNRSFGFGIGLRTVKRLVDAHGGRIAVESQQAQGSVFKVTLPRHLRFS